MAAKPWEVTLGTPPHSVRVFERGPSAWIYYRSGTKQVRKSLSIPLRTRLGVLDPRAVERAVKEGERRLAEIREALLSPGRETPTEGAPTITKSRTLIQDPLRGKYPHPTQHRAEVVRALTFAADVWYDKPWNEVTRADFTALGRARVQWLHEQGFRGFRGAEKLVMDVVAVANWLRLEGRIGDAEGRPAPDWKQELRAYWRQVSGTKQDYAAHHPRHTVSDYRKLLAAGWEVDPRFGLLLELGAGFRLGQVVRCMRSDLRLAEGVLRIPGTGSKQGALVELTAGQRDAAQRSLAGHLERLETLWQAGRQDYHLFPQGKLARGAAIREDRGVVSRPAVSRWFRWAEEKAGIRHQEGRGAYGLRRLSVDHALDQKISLPGLQAAGGWSTPDVPTSVYAEQQRRSAAGEARDVRAILRGES